MKRSVDIDAELARIKRERIAREQGNPTREQPREKPRPVIVQAATADETKATKSTLVTQCAADIAPERINWLWPGRLARGKHTCVAGEPGTGKSQNRSG